MNDLHLITQAVSVQERPIQAWQVEAALALLNDGATVPFIARYRKERTGELDEIQLRQIAERYEYFKELSLRKKTILEAIAKQDELTPELRQTIENCQNKTELEDLYLPYRTYLRSYGTAASLLIISLTKHKSIFAFAFASVRS